MALMRFDPFREMDRIAEQVMAGSRVPRTMPMEAFRRGDEFFVFIDIPGVDEDDVELTVERNVVSIRAQRVSPRQEGDEVLVDERPHGVFARQLFLGDNLDAGKLSADYNRGVLMMRIPIAEASKPRRITVSQHDDAAPDNGSARADQAADQQPAASTS
ncbi:MAG: Hsp20/alpha crystallin family protein [Pseudonocardiaceae bacterium]